jgi:hypothetical protein
VGHSPPPAGRPRFCLRVPSSVHVVGGCQPLRASCEVRGHHVAGEPAAAAPAAWHPPRSRAPVGLKSRSANRFPNPHLAPLPKNRDHRTDTARARNTRRSSRRSARPCILTSSLLHVSPERSASTSRMTRRTVLSRFSPNDTRTRQIPRKVSLVPEARIFLALRAPGSIAGGLRGVVARAIWYARPFPASKIRRHPIRPDLGAAAPAPPNSPPRRPQRCSTQFGIVKLGEWAKELACWSKRMRDREFCTS